MKKFYLLALGLGIFLTSYGQSERLVLLEECTNASCGPCAAQNPGFNALLNANTGDAISIKYQTDFPGYDPMNEHNPGEVENRFFYYNMTGVPTAAIDGELPTFSDGSYQGAPGAITQPYIDDAQAIPASFDLEIDYTLTPENISVTVTATCTQAASGNLKMRIAVIEKAIIFESAPGSNGETEFYNVMKKMLPNADGASMESSYSVGDTYTDTQTWELANVYDLEEIAVVAFIQNDDDKTVLQAAFAEEEPLEPEFSIDATVLDIEVPEGICESVFTPSVIIRNHGSETLTSLDIHYTINNVDETYSWTGSLPFFETETVNLPEITFTAEAENEFEITLMNPNASADENTENDNRIVPIVVAEESTDEVTVSITFDTWAEETSWEITNQAGEVVASGDNYDGQGGQTLEETVELPTTGCYEFSIFDVYGDGLNGAYWIDGYNGFYTITSSDGTVLAEGGGAVQFFEENTPFNVTSLTGVNDTEFDGTVEVFPNPTSEMLNLRINLTESQDVRLEVRDILGRLVLTEDLGKLSTGEFTYRADMSAYNSGIYLVTLTTANSQLVKKITITD